MSNYIEAQQKIITEVTQAWIDPLTAQWAIQELPLLSRLPSAEVPILEITRDYQLFMQNDVTRLATFLDTPKLVASGGFEGTAGHVNMTREMLDTSRVLSMGQPYSIHTGVMLESNSFAYAKGRDPIIPQELRTQLWAQSGLVDFVITLPDQPNDPSLLSNHYQNIHQLLGRTLWSASVENPHWREIIDRGLQGNYYIPCLLNEEFYSPSTSFIAETQNLTFTQLVMRLRSNLKETVRHNHLSAWRYHNDSIRKIFHQTTYSH